MGLINLRNALMAEKRLLYDAEVEYLRGDGRSGIDTGLKPVVGWKYEFTFTPRAGFNGCIFGAGQGNDYLQIVQGTYAKFVLYHSTAPRQIDLGFVADTTYHCVFDSSTLIMNGVSQDGLWGTRYISRNIAILARYYDNSLGFNSSNIDLHCFKIYDTNNILIFDAIPVRKGAVGYLYDRVSGALFGNAGTGDFVVGPDVVPVEYIESHGTEWIDTGVDASLCNTEEMTIKCNFSVTGTGGPGGQYNGIFGAAVPRFGVYTLWQNLCWGYAIAHDNVKSFTFGNWVDATCIFVKNNQSATFDGETFTATNSGTLASLNIGLFCRNYTNTPQWLALARIKNCDIEATSARRHFRPVRVGTDATSWEGAMIDTLTRRIYRNAGTGSFGYGNDLKYPIPAA